MPYVAASALGAKRLAKSTPASSFNGATPSTMMSARVSAKSDLKIFFRFVFIVFYLRFVFMRYFFTAVPFYASVVLYASLAEFSQSYISTLSEKHNILSIIDGF